MLEFDACVGCGELPIGLGVVGVAIILPSCDFVDQGLFIRDAAIEALGRKDSEFGLRHVEPTAVLWRVVPFETRSPPLNRTTYFFTIISFAALITSVIPVATEANHQIHSKWLKRATSKI